MDTTYEVRAIVWPAKHVIKENLPLCFKKFYPYVRCTEVNLKRIMTNNNSNSSFSFLPGPGFKNKLGSSSMEYLIGASFKVWRGPFQ
jgi:hypothetical protein